MDTTHLGIVSFCGSGISCPLCVGSSSGENWGDAKRADSKIKAKQCTTERSFVLRCIAWIGFVAGSCWLTCNQQTNRPDEKRHLWRSDFLPWRIAFYTLQRVLPIHQITLKNSTTSFWSPESAPNFFGAHPFFILCLFPDRPGTYEPVSAGHVSRSRLQVNSPSRVCLAEVTKLFGTFSAFASVLQGWKRGATFDFHRTYQCRLWSELSAYSAHIIASCFLGPVLATFLWVLFSPSVTGKVKVNNSWMGNKKTATAAVTQVLPDQIASKKSEKPHGEIKYTLNSLKSKKKIACRNKSHTNRSKV